MERELPEEFKKYYEDIKYVFGHYSNLPYPAFCTCVHKKSKKIVTIDQCNKGFSDHYKRLRIWLELKHPCIRQLYYVHNGKSALYVVREHMEYHLKDAIVAQILQPLHVKYIMYQLFRLFSYLHSANVICMTLRPIYFGINDDCELKLVNQLPVVILPVSEADRSDDFEISDRWYQAPELILVDNYASLSTAMNMWTLGTILAELLSHRIIFGGSMVLSQQLIKMINALGRPTEQDLIDIGSTHASSYLEGIEPDDRRDFNEILPNAPDDALDLLRKLLTWSPKNRITAEEALKHPFLAEIIQGNYGPHAMDPPTIIVPSYNEINDRIQKDPNSRSEMIKEINSKIPRIVMLDTKANMKVLAFNIARSSEACNLLPIELWQRIFASMDDNNSFGSYEKIAKQMYIEYRNRTKQ